MSIDPRIKTRVGFPAGAPMWLGSKATAVGSPGAAGVSCLLKSIRPTADGYPRSENGKREDASTFRSSF